MNNSIVFKLAHKWFFRHKFRYVLSWISFSLASIILVSVYAVGGELQNDLVGQLTANPLNYQIRVRNTLFDEEAGTIKHNLNEDVIYDIAKQTNSTNVRLLFDTSLQVSSVDGREYDNSLGGVALYESDSTLLLTQEIQYLDYISPGDSDFGFDGRMTDKSENSVIVTSEFLQRCNVSEDKAIGLGLTLSDEDGNEYPCLISALITAKGSIPAFAIADVYVPYVADSIITKAAHPSINVVTYTYEEGTIMEDVVDFFLSRGYMCSTPNDAVDTIQATKNTIVAIGSVVGILVLSLASFGMVNSVLVTLNENLPFISLLKLIGLRDSQFVLLVIYMTGIQGLIGGVLGCILTYLFQKQIFVLIRLFDLNMSSLLSGFEPSFVVCLPVVAMCVLVSLIASLLVVGFKKNVTIHNLYENQL